MRKLKIGFLSFGVYYSEKVSFKFLMHSIYDYINKYFYFIIHREILEKVYFYFIIHSLFLNIKLN